MVWNCHIVLWWFACSFDKSKKFEIYLWIIQYRKNNLRELQALYGLDISDNLKYKIYKHILVSVLEHGTDNVSIIVQDVLCKTREQFGEKSAEILYKLFETNIWF